MNTQFITYLQFNPYYVYGENETPLQTKQKTDKYFSMPFQLRKVCTDFATSDKIKEIVIQKNQLSVKKARQVSYLVRLVFFGELPISDFINRVSDNLAIDRKSAQSIALEINKEIFSKVAKELKEIQKKFPKPKPQTMQFKPVNIKKQAPNILAQTQPAPPPKLPTLTNEYEEKKDNYLEPAKEKDEKDVVRGNLVNLR